MDQPRAGIIQAAVEADDELEIRVGVLVDFSVRGVEDLLHESPLAGENCPGAPDAVTGDVVFLATAQLHGDELALQVVIQRGDQVAAVVVQVADPGGLRQIGVEELQLLALAALGGHAPAQSVVAIPHGVLAHPVVHAGQQTVGVVFEQVVGALAEESVLVHAVL